MAQGEKKILRENGMRAFSMHDIDKYAHPWRFRHRSKGCWLIDTWPAWNWPRDENGAGTYRD